MTAKPKHPIPDYAQIVSQFVSSGAALIRESIGERYHGLVDPGNNLLEPGFISPDLRPRVMIISYYPNATDLDKPGTPEYQAARNRVLAWAESGSVEAYRACYAAWLADLNRTPFHKRRTKPILDEAGLRDEDIAFIPFIKAPMPAGSSPGSEIIEIDIDVTWGQLLLVKPEIVWIQGVAISERVEGLVKGRITEKLVMQRLTRIENEKDATRERLRVANRLRDYLAPDPRSD